MDSILISIIIITIGLLISYYTVYDIPAILIDNNEMFLVIEDNMIMENNSIYLKEENIFISLEIINKYIDPNVFYDKQEEILIFTFEDKVIRQKLKDNYYTINSQEELPAKVMENINNIIYIPLETIEDIYNMNFDYVKDSKAIVLTFKDREILNGEIILSKGTLREAPTIQSATYLKDLEVGTILKIYEKVGKWYKVRTELGIVGYIEEKYVKIKYYKDGKEKVNSQKNKYSNRKINLVWDHFINGTSLDSNYNYIEGVNIISPTWFSIIDENGTVKDMVNEEYVRRYKDLSYEIWALVDNSFNPELTHKILNSSITREKIILDLFKRYQSYGLDGINLDFENINIEDKDLYIQFIKELYPVFKGKGMVVTVDVTPISISENWSKSFDREAMADIVDYIMLMAYDQHWSTSPKAGSVAQYTWVEKSIIEALEQVPNNKLILGVPSYTRLWEEEKNNGKTEVSSKALSMEEAEKFIQDNNIDLIWDMESGQYYGEKKEENITYKIWLEDERSISLKVSLVNKYKLAGVASWRKGFEKEKVWEVINNQLKSN